MYWRKSCACYRNWKSSLHGSRWLILIKLLKIIGCKPTELSIYKGRLKSKKAANTTCFPCRTLNPNSYPVLSPCGRELERGQQAARLVLRWLGDWERLPKFGKCPLPNPPPRGRERIAADSSVAGRLKKNTRNINGGNFSGSLYRKADGTNAASVFFRRPLNPSVECVPQGAHAVGWGCRENG